MWSRVKDKELSKQMPFSYSHLNMQCTDSVRQGVSCHLRNALYGQKVAAAITPRLFAYLFCLTGIFHFCLSRKGA
jgi:hypothetical protein